MTISTPVDTTAPATTTGVLLVPDYTLLDLHAPHMWNFTKVEEELGFTVTKTGPQDIYLYLVFPEITLREVDYFSLLKHLETVSQRMNLNVEFVQHACHDSHPDMPPM